MPISTAVDIYKEKLEDPSVPEIEARINQFILRMMDFSKITNFKIENRVEVKQEGVTANTP
jgi:hypothetical protein